MASTPMTTLSSASNRLRGTTFAPTLNYPSSNTGVARLPLPPPREGLNDKALAGLAVAKISESPKAGSPLRLGIDDLF